MGLCIIGLGYVAIPAPRLEPPLHAPARQLSDCTPATQLLDEIIQRVARQVLDLQNTMLSGSGFVLINESLSCTPAYRG